jgi:hypothetical protein
MFERLDEELKAIKMLITHYCIGKEITFWDKGSSTNRTGTCIRVNGERLTIVVPLWEGLGKEEEFCINLSKIREIK